MFPIGVITAQDRERRTAKGFVTHELFGQSIWDFTTEFLEKENYPTQNDERILGLNTG